MPRWKKKQLDDDDELERSKGKASVNATAKKYSIPVFTLHDHVKGKAKKVGAGRPTVLTHAEEEAKALYTVARCCKKLVWAKQRRLFLPLVLISCMRGKDSIFCKRMTRLGLVEWVLEKVVKACFYEIAAPVNQKSHLC